MIIAAVLNVCNVSIRLSRTGNQLAVQNAVRALAPFLCSFLTTTLGRLPTPQQLIKLQLVLLYDFVVSDSMAWDTSFCVALMRFVYSLFIPYEG